MAYNAHEEQKSITYFLRMVLDFMIYFNYLIYSGGLKDYNKKFHVFFDAKVLLDTPHINQSK